MTLEEHINLIVSYKVVIEELKRQRHKKIKTIKILIDNMNQLIVELVNNPLEDKND